jgi:hypothetical protein
MQWPRPSCNLHLPLDSTLVEMRSLWMDRMVATEPVSCCDEDCEEHLYGVSESATEMDNILPRYMT